MRSAAVVWCGVVQCAVVVQWCGGAVVWCGYTYSDAHAQILVFNGPEGGSVRICEDMRGYDVICEDMRGYDMVWYEMVRYMIRYDMILYDLILS